MVHVAKKLQTLNQSIFFQFFLSVNVQHRTENCPPKKKKKIDFTERPRLSNLGKAIAMPICPIIVHFITQRAHCV